MTKIKRTAKGEPLVCTLRIRVFKPENKGSMLTTCRCAPGKGWTDPQIEGILEQVAEQLETNRSREDFEMVQVGPGQFNFVWRRWARRKNKLSRFGRRWFRDGSGGYRCLDCGKARGTLRSILRHKRSCRR